MAENFKLQIEYDGTAYAGWQRQKNHPTIQEKIENALATITRQPVKLHGSGRTDAGVHALGQSASFSCETRMKPDQFKQALNSLLPEDIVIQDCSRAAPDFHARYNARSKKYRYRIHNHPDPVAIGRQYAWHIRKSLDIDAMQSAARLLTGTHDFKAFEASGSPRSSTRRTVYSAEVVRENEDILFFEIEADGFLRFMVRNIVGTIVDVGLGKISPPKIREILESRNRGNAGITAPPQGLFLVEVNYT